MPAGNGCRHGNHRANAAFAGLMLAGIARGG